ncbi:MAG: DUF58 domain-containing protein [Bacilli bacterium]|nr:DUF58 domain-containing protein [Bacilli bacterium]
MKTKYIEKIKANISINSSKKAIALLNGLYRSIYKGRSMDFDDLRDYTLGDESKDIDWKSSIRNGSLLVRRYEALKRHNVVFIIDNNIKMDGVTSSYEHKRDVLMYVYGTLAYLVCKNGDEVATSYVKENTLYMTSFKESILNVELTLNDLENHVTEENNYTLLDRINYCMDNSKRKMIFVIISDISGMESIDNQLLKNVTASHDLLFINISDASLFGDDLYDLDSKNNVPKLFSKNYALKQVEENIKQELIEEQSYLFTKYRVSSTTINSKNEIVNKIIDLLERHNHAVKS